jgi:hypothetical protein
VKTVHLILKIKTQKKLLLVLAVLAFGIVNHPAFGQNKNCSLSADDLIHLVKANDKVDDILLQHCFVSDKSATNGAKANFTRDYKTGGNLDQDLIFTVKSGQITMITTSATTFGSYKEALKNKGFKYAGKDEYGAKCAYNNYLVYANTSKDDKGNPNYIFMPGNRYWVNISLI